jgi:hypothetical protein
MTTSLESLCEQGSLNRILSVFSINKIVHFLHLRNECLAGCTHEINQNPLNRTIGLLIKT